MRKELESILCKGGSQAGVKITKTELHAFSIYLKELMIWNRSINLTGIRDEKGIIVRHFLDSLFINSLVSESEAILDMGTGAGFPGIPLKIVRPLLKLTLMEASAKKAGFLKHIKRMLGLTDLNIIKGRAECFIGKMQFEKIVSRAAGPLREIITIGGGLLKDGGIFLAMKGKRGADEWESMDMRNKRQWKLEGIYSYTLPFSDLERSVLILRFKGRCFT